MPTNALAHPYWQHAPKCAIYLLHFKGVVFLTFFVMAMVDVARIQVWGSDPDTWYMKDYSYEVGVFCARSLPAILVEIIWTIASTVLICIGRFHPLLPTIVSPILAGLWVFSSWYNYEHAYYRSYADSKWRELVIGECGVAAGLAANHIGIFVFSAIGLSAARRIAKYERQGGFGPLFGGVPLTTPAKNSRRSAEMQA